MLWRCHGNKDPHILEVCTRWNWVVGFIPHLSAWENNMLSGTQNHHGHEEKNPCPCWELNSGCPAPVTWLRCLALEEISIPGMIN
jgi:hypothetical protein